MRASSIPYQPAIDGLRAIAVGLVIAAHTAPGFVAGRIGVDLFFVISGYLITTILAGELDRDGRVHFGAFYVRRFLRLGPPLIALLVAYLASSSLWRVLGASESDLVVGALAGLTYTWNFLVLAIDGPVHAGFGLAHLWSLAQEEQFYLVLPLLLVAAGTRRLRSRRSTVFALGLMITAGALYVLTAPSIFSEFSPVTRSAGLFAGVAVALHTRQRGARRVSAWLAWAAVLVTVGVVVAVQLGGLPAWVDIPVAVLGGMVLVAHLASHEGDGRLGRLLAVRPLPALGLISYAVYLWHLPLIVIFADLLHLERIQTVASVIPAALGLAVLTRRWIERPAQALRVEFDRSGSRGSREPRAGERAAQRPRGVSS